MKNVLLTILTILIVTIMAVIMSRGINIGSLQILGFQGIADENQNLLNAIEQSKQKNNEYTTKVEKINSDAEKLASAKKEYFDLVQVSTASEIQEAMQIKSYRVEYLWSRIGNHATQEGVTVKMEIVASSMGDSAYKNLQFSVNGNYLAISNFIYDLENDESLDFTIDNFDMKSGVATFIVKDVKIIQEEKSYSIPSVNNNNVNQNITNTTNETTADKKTDERTNAVVNAFTPNN